MGKSAIMFGKCNLEWRDSFLCQKSIVSWVLNSKMDYSISCVELLVKTTVFLEFSTKEKRKVKSKSLRDHIYCSTSWYNPHFFSTAKDCGGLKTPSNGSLVGNLTTYPNKVQFICDEGFILRGSKIRQCLSTGKWSGNESFCEGTTKCGENVIYRKQLSP